MPAASTHIVMTSWMYGVSTRKKATPASPTATKPRPAAPITSAPNRATSFGVCGATNIITNEIGSSRTAASSGE